VADQIDGAQHGAQVKLARRGQPTQRRGVGIQNPYIQRAPVKNAFEKLGKAMGMRYIQPGHHQLAAGIDHILNIFSRQRLAHRSNTIAFDQHIPTLQDAVGPVQREYRSVFD